MDQIDALALDQLAQTADIARHHQRIFRLERQFVMDCVNAPEIMLQPPAGRGNQRRPSHLGNAGSDIDGAPFNPAGFQFGQYLQDDGGLPAFSALGREASALL